MNLELATVLSLRRVLESARDGMGISKAIVEELSDGYPKPEPARLLLLGYPLSVSLRSLEEDQSQEASMLASLIISTPRSSAALVGKNGEGLANTMERWVKARESAKLEWKVLRFRSLLTSGILGAVTAMVASLGPLVGNLNFMAPAVAGAQALLPAAGLMTAVSSGVLGLFMSGRKFFFNVAVSLMAFAIVSAITSPLVNVPAVALWGVK